MSAEYEMLNNLIQDDLDLDQNLACNWLSCFQQKYGLYLCKYHTELVQNEKKKKQELTNQCAHKKCKQEKCFESNLCLMHETTINSLKIKKMYQCVMHGCEYIQQYQKKYCVKHYGKQ